MNIKKIRRLLNDRQNSILNPLATYDDQAVRRWPGKIAPTEYRQPFSLDVDRILHSLAYTRYIDKTQVFSLIMQDHLTHRVLHVQLVSRIARTIGEYLNLNTSLIEAIALGHDIGHTPFGHAGEECLTRLCQSCGIGSFYHSVQSVQFLENVEQKGKGLNLCLQTLDGALCHDGERTDQSIRPQGGLSFEKLATHIRDKKSDPDTKLVPATLEGAVVRFADSIGYIGRDIEDAIRLQLITRGDLPRRCVDLLGDSNGKIVYNLVTNVIENSYMKDYITYSDDVFEALRDLKQFNYERIYFNTRIRDHLRRIPELFEMLFEQYLNDLKTRNHASAIYTQFLDGMSPEYLGKFRDAEIVRDFISGMTDNYFLMQCPERLRPRPITL